MKYTALVSLLAVSMFSAQAQAAGDAKAGEAKAQACVGCHGVNGNSMIPNFPKLAGQHAGYTAKQLADFKAGKQRYAPEMLGMVANLSEQDMADLAAYYAKQQASMGKADKQLVSLGEKLYRGGNKNTGVTACIACHGPRGAGNPPANFPRINGQHTAYLVKSLKDFRAGYARCSNDITGAQLAGIRCNDLNGMMRSIAAKMTDDEIEAVASYVSGLH